MLGCYLVAQMGSGPLLSLGYLPTTEAERLLVQLNADINGGAMVQGIHAVGAGMVLGLVYLHMSSL